MKKIINDPSNVVPEMLAGLVKAYPDYVTQLPDTTILIRSDQASMQGKVGLVSGGGSGHESSHTGFVGAGTLSAAVALLHQHQTKSMKQSKQQIKVVGPF